MTSEEIEHYVAHQKKVWKAFQDSFNNTIRRAMRNFYPNEPLEKLHEWGLVTKTTLTKDGIVEDDGSIKIKW